MLHLPVLILLTVVKASTQIQINNIYVPRMARNNSGHPVVLECNYSLRPDDTDLVVKWYLNGDLVYEWVPPQPPQSFGVLKDRLDLEYKASGDPKTKHSAMKIKNPTTDIEGEYKCYVSSFADEDFTSKVMVVFEPEKSLVIHQGKPKENYINFTCVATEVYPEPQLMVYKDKKWDMRRKTFLEEVEWNTMRHPDGKFTVLVTSQFALSSLQFGSLIFCELRLPAAGYVKKKILLYYPEDAQNWNGCCILSPNAILIVIIVKVCVETYVIW